MQIDGFVAVFFNGVLELLGDDVKRFVPRDALELVFAALAHAFHRVLQAFGRIQALTHGAAAQAGTDVRYRQRHLGRVGAGVFRFDANHLAILDNGFQRATATAVDNARSPANGFHIIHGRSNGLTERREREIGQNACSGGGLQKRPAAQALGTN